MTSGVEQNIALAVPDQRAGDGQINHRGPIGIWEIDALPHPEPSARQHMHPHGSTSLPAEHRRPLLGKRTPSFLIVFTGRRMINEGIRIFQIERARAHREFRQNLLGAFHR